MTIRVSKEKTLEQNKRYYRKHSKSPEGGTKWNAWDCSIIVNSTLRSALGDVGICKIIGRSLKAVQIKRWRLKKNG